MGYLCFSCNDIMATSLPPYSVPVMLLSRATSKALQRISGKSSCVKFGLCGFYISRCVIWPKKWHIYYIMSPLTFQDYRVRIDTFCDTPMYGDHWKIYFLGVKNIYRKKIQSLGNYTNKWIDWVQSNYWVYVPKYFKLYSICKAPLFKALLIDPFIHQ